MAQLQSPAQLLEELQNPNTKLSHKYMNIFKLKDQKHHQQLIQCFNHLDNSELLKHEVTYALGQMQFHQQSAEFLKTVLEDETEFPVVRHEAGEALSNYGVEEYIQLLKKYVDSKVEEVRDTCRLGLSKLKSYQDHKESYGKHYNNTIEPAVPANLHFIDQFSRSKKEKSFQSLSQNEQTQFLESLVLNCSIDLFDRYRVMYFIRDSQKTEFCQILNSILNKKNRQLTNILMRHEACFIIGQLSQTAKCTLDQLKQTIEDQSESEIVRHEAISGYVSLTDDKTILKTYSEDQSRLVRESCIVALDLVDYWNE